MRKVILLFCIWAFSLPCFAGGTLPELILKYLVAQSVVYQTSSSSNSIQLVLNLLNRCQSAGEKTYRLCAEWITCSSSAITQEERANCNSELSEPSALESLPTELIVYIRSFLDLRSAGHLAQGNRNLYNILQEETQYKIYLRQKMEQKMILGQIPKHFSLKDLKGFWKVFSETRIAVGFVNQSKEPLDLIAVVKHVNHHHLTYTVNFHFAPPAIFRSANVVARLAPGQATVVGLKDLQINIPGNIPGNIHAMPILGWEIPEDGSRLSFLLSADCNHKPLVLDGKKFYFYAAGEKNKENIYPFVLPK
jgi:hypothetical protein